MVFVGAPSATVLVLSCSHAVPFGPFGRSFVHGCSSFVAVHIRARFFHRFGFHVYLSPYHMDNRAALSLSCLRLLNSCRLAVVREVARSERSPIGGRRGYRSRAKSLAAVVAVIWSLLQ